ncbi:N-acyl-L-amino acid amidohydrolase [Leptolyngbya boryana NIES-2135]|jgi:amidohydrolase|uniref:N-acyl-L-amino acid amidohydrolase n=1 Tax=Leptolyngbya boryana NIES-2135 TaxID=1973484 RepID=A0A1Z4JN42_LEPBY|nr:MULTISPECIES: M20 family metallopeptidase [Leptolyngbya]BAY58068.1 N-acyl-L-amino acid amidohydrolase [Leptolyngbya boryana NIES-2135]MBD2367510.1 amidohydrolase [Leptolyngbya sp. FACHB-161]MBD2374034.1 amidohydrolase [Leptolyngbya sp. FACHB-238]MBD2398166.1 amidohydrolase [Leptolyngbya sp. FACHB-239]MBD2404337.1 amidohydrolase [Leptolyngbya sp. FACHB-402]
MVSTFLSSPSVDVSQIRLEIRSLQAQLVTWRRQLHQRPELGFREQLTAEFITQKLQEWQIPHETGIAKTGIVATIAGNRPGRVLAIRADMDALPIQEQNDVPYKSQHDGLMHACGHDGHVTIALGTAYYLSQHRDFSGTVKIIFQPAEEGPGGAKPMIEAGVLKKPDVDAIVGLHIWNNLPLGMVGVRTGALMAAVETFDFTIVGKGGHGAIPQQTIDSVLVGAQIVNTLQTIVARNVDPIDSAVVTVGEFHSGTACNVIAASARLRGTVRYFNPKYAGYFAQRIEQIVAGICQAHGATYEFNYDVLYPPVINDGAIADLVRSIAETVIESPLGVVPDCQTMGGEDMAFFLQEVPGCYFFLGSANSEKGLDFPHHHPRFDFDETVLGMGVEFFVRIVETFR